MYDARRKDNADHIRALLRARQASVEEVARALGITPLEAWQRIEGHQRWTRHELALLRIHWTLGSL